ncbi:MAG: NADH dehydrogenase (quinone) subunit G [Nitrospirae bacterium]|nr:MAG: NADH dehydrogenase (quinone) subunit G [Nitrospirota bacterium]
MSQETGQPTVTLTIDGMTITVPKDTLVIEAARQAGVMIPHFCYHPKLAPDANCRMCFVEIEKMPRLQTSCSTKVAEGMVVRTTSPTVQQARKSVLEFILANHPLDCPVCDQGGRCDLQDFSHEYTPPVSRFTELKRVFPKEYFSALIETQMNRCVQCLRCVRYCDQVMDVKALAPQGRGTLTEIKSFGHHELDCEFCGGCVQICPVGAITSRLSMYEFRPWMLKRAETICGYCGDGCEITLQTKENRLIEVNSTLGGGRNNADLCARGFFGYHASTHPDRLTTPLVRKDGHLVEVTWEEALETVAAQVGWVKDEYGPEAIGGLISARCTNEDLYLFQKFMRLVLGTNHLDSSVRYGYMNAIEAFRRVQGLHRWTVTFDDVVAADTLMLIGTNVTETNPITGLKIKEAVKQRGARLITLESLKPVRGTISNIATLATHHLELSPDQFGIGVLGLIKAVFEQGLVDSALEQEAPEYVGALRTKIEAITWDRLLAHSTLTPSMFHAAVRTFEQGARSIVVVGQGVLRSPGGYATMVNIHDVLLLLGRLDRPGCGIAALAEENNEQGAIEMGAVPDLLPGALPVSDPEARRAVAASWGQEPPRTPGLTMMEMIERAKTGHLKALFVVGENPLGSLPPSAGVAEALDRVELLVCQELFLTETAQRAHVVLPACSYAEKDGTCINTEGHTQAVRKAIEPLGESRPDWEIFSALSVLLDSPMEYETAKDLTKEIRNMIPASRVLGPAPLPPRPDREVLRRYILGGYRDDLDGRLTPPPVTKTTGTMTLSFAQSLFHSGKFSTKAKGLLKIQSAGVANLNPQDAERLGVRTGDRIEIRNEGGSAITPVRAWERVPEGVVVFPEHFDQDLRQVMSVTVDPRTGVPYCKLARVSVEKV